MDNQQNQGSNGNNTQQLNQAPQTQPQQPISEINQQQPLQSPPSQEPSQQPTQPPSDIPPSYTPAHQYSYSHDEGFFSRGNLLRLFIGLIALLGVAGLIFFVVIPMLRPKPVEQITLRYWTVWEDAKAYEPVLAEFRKKYPNITVKVERQDIKTLGRYIERLGTRIQGGEGPDVLSYHNSWITQIKPLLLPLPVDVVSASELDKKYYDVIKSDVSIRGAYYGIPLGIDTLSLLINTDLFKAAGITSYPTTWDDLIKDARQITVKEQGNKIKTAGVALGAFDNVEHAPDIMALLFIQNGADLNDLAGEKRKFAEDALDFYSSFSNSDSKVWDDTLDNSKLAFTKGNLGMFFGYSWDILDIKAANPNLSFVVVPVPHVSGTSQNRNKTIASYWVEGVSNKTKHPTESFELLKFLSQKDSLEKTFTQVSSFRLFGQAYPRTDMKDELKSNQYLYPIVTQADNAVSTFFSSDTFDDALNSYLNSYLGNAIRSIKTGVSSATAIETLSKGIDQKLTQYEK